LPFEAVRVPLGVRRDVADRGKALTDPAGAPRAGGDDHGIRNEEAILVDRAREQGRFTFWGRFLLAILAVPGDEDVAYPPQFVQPCIDLVPPGIAGFRLAETGALFPGRPIAALEVNHMVSRVHRGSDCGLKISTACQNCAIRTGSSAVSPPPQEKCSSQNSAQDDIAGCAARDLNPEPAD
jgi:hypothetical protein